MDLNRARTMNEEATGGDSGSLDVDVPAAVNASPACEPSVRTMGASAGGDALQVAAG